jgi:hypothetical protein
MAEGIEVRITKDGSKSYRASVWSNRDRRRIRKTFDSLAAAKNWRADALSSLAKGALRAPKPVTVREAWENWYEGAEAGTIRNRSGDIYKPSSLRSLERAMRLRVLSAQRQQAEEQPRGTLMGQRTPQQATRRDPTRPLKRLR